MKKKVAPILLASLLLLACTPGASKSGDASNGGDAGSSSSEVTCSSLNKTTLRLAVGETFELKWSDGSTLSYGSANSSKKDVATIDEHGLITAIAPGSTNITVPVPGTRCMAYCYVTVVESD